MTPGAYPTDAELPTSAFLENEKADIKHILDTLPNSTMMLFMTYTLNDDKTRLKFLLRQMIIRNDTGRKEYKFIANYIRSMIK